MNKPLSIKIRAGNGMLFLALHFLFILYNPVAIAAQSPPVFYITLSSGTTAPGSDVLATIHLDTEFPVNVFEIALAFDERILEFVSFDNSRSIVAFWRPDSPRSEAGAIVLEGGSAEPFSGTRGEIITVRFRTRAPGAALFSFERANLYRADGSGSRVAAASVGNRLTVDADAPLVLTLPAEDLTPPVFQEAAIVKNPIGPGRLFIFLAADRESGIAVVEARRRSWFFWSEWRPIQNPTALSFGTWAIEARALNAAGATTTQMFVDRPHFFFVILAAGFGSGALFLGFRVFSRRRLGR